MSAPPSGRSTPTFLTALAPDARIRGSRDPLGLLPIWARLGRALIGNVTTVSGDLRGWTTLLTVVGLVRDRIESGAVDGTTLEPLFRAEQMVAYSRTIKGSNEARGTNLVKHRLRAHDNGREPIRLGTTPRERRILANQGAAGVMGQIGSPAAASLLFDRARRALTPAAMPLWTNTLAPRLASASGRITAILRDERGFAPAGADAELADTLADLHRPRLAAAEVPLYRDHVLYAGRGLEGAQARFVELWRGQGPGTALRDGIDLPRLASLAQQARSAGLPEVAGPLEDIFAAEQLLAPMERLFAWVQSRDRQTLDDVVAELEKVWTEPLSSAAAATDLVIGPSLREVYRSSEVLGLFTGVREALVQGSWRTAIQGLIDLNAVMMKRRGGAPWMRVVDGTVEVLMGDEPGDLPPLPDLRRQLVHSYYLDPLRRLVVAWEDGQHG